jgi:hypothetical protein
MPRLRLAARWLYRTEPMGTAKKKPTSKKTSLGAGASSGSESAGLGSGSLTKPGASQPSAAAYQQFLPAAMALPATGVIRCNTDGVLAYGNASTGVASLTARASDARALPGVNVAALSLLPAQCLAVAYAESQFAQLSGRATPGLAALLAQGSALRTKLFVAADALVSAGLLPAPQVKALHKGHGQLDTAKDLEGLAALFAANAAAIKGKTAIVPADWTTAASLGTQLTTLLHPKGSKKTRPADMKKAANVRDRLWTLARQTYDALWSACAFLYGPEGLDARVPALGAHAATTSKRKKANAVKRAAKAAGAAATGAAAGTTK